MSQNLLKKLKNKLSRNGDNFTEYNNVIKEYLKKVMYLTCKTATRGDYNSTKLRVAFYASAKKVGHTLNKAIYKARCSIPLLFDVFARL